MMGFSRTELVAESLRIEGIRRRPTKRELTEFDRFMALATVDVQDLEQFVGVYQPGAVLRLTPFQNVRVGDHRPPSGGPGIRVLLQEILDEANSAVKRYMGRHLAFEIHTRYEWLHPFTDCNGRSGRMLWFWMMQEMPGGFLHEWYYQSLSAK